MSSSLSFSSFRWASFAGGALCLWASACGGSDAERAEAPSPSTPELEEVAAGSAGVPLEEVPPARAGRRSRPPEAGVVSAYPEEDRPISAELQRVRYLVEGGQCDEALARLEPILVGPEGQTADPLYWRGRCAASEERWGDAVRDLKAATEIDPAFVGALQHLSDAYVMQRDCRSALPYLDRLVELRPEDGVAYYNRGHCRYYLKDAEGSIADAHRGCELGHTPSCNLLPRLERRLSWQNGLRERGGEEERAPNEEVPAVERSNEGG